MRSGKNEGDVLVLNPIADAEAIEADLRSADADTDDLVDYLQSTASRLREYSESPAPSNMRDLIKLSIFKDEKVIVACNEKIASLIETYASPSPEISKKPTT